MFSWEIKKVAVRVKLWSARQSEFSYIFFLIFVLVIMQCIFKIFVWWFHYKFLAHDNTLWIGFFLFFFFSVGYWVCMRLIGCEKYMIVCKLVSTSHWFAWDSCVMVDLVCILIWIWIAGLLLPIILSFHFLLCIKCNNCQYVWWMFFFINSRVSMDSKRKWSLMHEHASITNRTDRAKWLWLTTWCWSHLINIHESQWQ